MTRVRAAESFAGLLACMGAGQEADFDDETAERMAAEGYPVEIAGPGARPSGRKKAADAGPDAGDAGEGDGDDGGGAADAGPDAGA